MKINKLNAVAAGVALATAGAAHAISLGEVWVGDQQDGKLYIFDQSDLNDAGTDAVETTIDLSAVGNLSTRMHLIGFSNHPGFDPESRGVLAYLNGKAEVWHTNGGTHMPSYEATLDVSSTSLHECANDTSNTLLGCSSIGQAQIVFYDMAYDTGTYTKIGSFPLSGLTINSKVKGKAKKAINTAIDGGILTGKPICGNFNPDSSLYYVTTTGTPGVIVLDVTDPSSPTIRDAFLGSGVGCSLLNDPDGEHMWTNNGSKSSTDIEQAYKWTFADAYSNGKTGPRISVPLPTTGLGDVHGAQYAGIGGGTLWEMMRLDNSITVLDPDTGAILNQFSYQSGANTNPGGDVLDRSALGSRMYLSLRGAIPTTAITGINDPNRRPGVMVISSNLFGLSGTVLKTEDIQSGNEVTICPDGDEPDPDHDHGAFEVCTAGHEHFDDAVSVDTADPHGLKSLSYFTGFSS